MHRDLTKSNSLIKPGCSRLPLGGCSSELDERLMHWVIRFVT
jgi:hypothetical protein